MQPRARSVRSPGRAGSALFARLAPWPQAAAGALALLGLIAAAPARADWLVTRDGERIETKGAWQVKRQLVVFHLASGKLASLKLADVDLEASREATEAAAEPAPRKEAPTQREPVRPALVLTDADVSHVRPSLEPTPNEEGDEAEAAEAGAEAAAEGAGAEETAPPERLIVTGWGEVDDPSVQGVTITGQLSNSSPDVTAGASVTVKLYDADGELIASTDARLTSTTLTPGQTANFRASFPSIFVYETVRFESQSVAVKSGADEPAADE